MSTNLRRNALDTLSEQQWRTIAIETRARTARTYIVERVIDEELVKRGHGGHNPDCRVCSGDRRGFRAVIWSDVMKARVP